MTLKLERYAAIDAAYGMAEHAADASQSYDVKLA